MSSQQTSLDKLRNVAIIAHVDHGKTTLVDKLLQQSGTLDSRKGTDERVMDSNALEKERGITILAKNTAINWNDYRINILDTPGHADFGGEVERVLSMADSVLLLVDAVDGPMPQTRFVTQKAFAHGLNPIVVINKIDRPGARPDWVMDQVFDLFDNLGATDEQLDFPVVYASALQGWASMDDSEQGGDMTPLFQAIIDQVSPPNADPEGELGRRFLGSVAQGAQEVGGDGEPGIADPPVPQAELGGLEAALVAGLTAVQPLLQGRPFAQTAGEIEPQALEGTRPRLPLSGDALELTGSVIWFGHGHPVARAGVGRPARRLGS